MVVVRNHSPKKVVVEQDRVQLEGSIVLWSELYLDHLIVKTIECEQGHIEETRKEQTLAFETLLQV